MHSSLESSGPGPPGPESPLKSEPSSLEAQTKASGSDAPGLGGGGIGPRVRIAAGGGDAIASGGAFGARGDGAPGWPWMGGD